MPVGDHFTMFTRVDLKNNICTSDQYYAQFVNTRVKNFVSGMIGLEWIISCNSVDEIPMIRWNTVALSLCNMVSKNLLTDCEDYWSLSVGVAIAKTAAKQIKNSAKLDAV